MKCSVCFIAEDAGLTALVYLPVTGQLGCTWRLFLYPEHAGFISFVSKTLFLIGFLFLIHYVCVLRGTVSFLIPSDPDMIFPL